MHRNLIRNLSAISSETLERAWFQNLQSLVMVCMLVLPSTLNTAHTDGDLTGFRDQQS